VNHDKLKTIHTQAAAKRDKFERDLRVAFNDVASTGAGVRCLQAVYQASLGGAPESAFSATGELNTSSCIYRAARRDVYLSIRRFIPREALIEIEIPKEVSGGGGE
jgi:hypothetical protein